MNKKATNNKLRNFTFIVFGIILMGFMVVATTTITDNSVATTGDIIANNLNISGDLVINNLNVSGKVTTGDLEIISGSSITLAGAKFTNEGFFTSIDTNWIIDSGQSTSFLGVYSSNESDFAVADIVIQNVQNKSLNIIKSSETNPFAPNAGSIINEDGSLTMRMNHGQDFVVAHFDSLTKDDRGNVISLTGTERVLIINETHMTLNEATILRINGVASLSLSISVS